MNSINPQTLLQTRFTEAADIYEKQWQGVIAPLRLRGEHARQAVADQQTAIATVQAKIDKYEAKGTRSGIKASEHMNMKGELIGMLADLRDLENEAKAVELDGREASNDWTRSTSVLIERLNNDLGAWARIAKRDGKLAIQAILSGNGGEYVPE